MCLQAPPVLPIQMADFNGDGNNDLILSSRDGIYAWAQIRHPGTCYLVCLLTCQCSACAHFYHIADLHCMQPPAQRETSTVQVGCHLQLSWDASLS